MSSGWKQEGCYQLSESVSTLRLGVHVPLWEPSHPARPLSCLVFFLRSRGAADSRSNSILYKLRVSLPELPLLDTSVTLLEHFLYEISILTIFLISSSPPVLLHHVLRSGTPWGGVTGAAPQRQSLAVNRG